MRTKIISMLFLTTIVLAAGGGYVPIPAPVPMGTFDVNEGVLFHGQFKIEDAGGPKGIRLVIEPNELKITSSTVVSISGYKYARRYIYNYDFMPVESKTIIVKSYDSKDREVVNKIVFNVAKDTLQVFTECIEVKDSNESVSSIWWNNAQKKMRDVSRANLVREHNRVVEGKEPLSPNRESLDELKKLITKYDDPKTVVMNGHTVE